MNSKSPMSALEIRELFKTRFAEPRYTDLARRPKETWYYMALRAENRNEHKDYYVEARVPMMTFLRGEYDIERIKIQLMLTLLKTAIERETGGGKPQ